MGRKEWTEDSKAGMIPSEQQTEQNHTKGDTNWSKWRSPITPALSWQNIRSTIVLVCRVIRSLICCWGKWVSVSSLAVSGGDDAHRNPAPSVSKTDILQKFYHMRTGKLIKLLVGGLFAKMKNPYWTSYGNFKGSRITKIILKKKNKVEDSYHLILKLFINIE